MGLTSTGGTSFFQMNGLAICMFARYGSGGDPPLPLGMYAQEYPSDIFCDNIFNCNGDLEEGDGIAFIESKWDAFFHRTFFFYFVAIGYFLVIAMQTMGTMFGDRNQLEVRGDCWTSPRIGYDV